MGQETVICKDCKREYEKTENNDYYNAKNNHDGVCLDCLLRGGGIDPNDVVEVEIYFIENTEQGSTIN